jgi:SAM-dependent methyltransferase
MSSGGGKTAGSWDATWEAIYRTREEVKYPPEHLVRFVARNFYAAPDRKAVRILDLGSGAGGACAWYMAREGFTVASIDASPTGVDKARRRFADESLTVDARVGDVVQLPWDEGTFDAVVDNGCLCCNPFDNCKRIVAEVRRVLKPGGRFLSVNLTDRCTEYGLGRGTEPGGFADMGGDGPLSGGFFYLFMGRPQVDLLYAPFSEVTVDLVSRTAFNQRYTVEFWVVACRRPLA